VENEAISVAIQGCLSYSTSEEEGLDRSVYANYQPISNLNTISNIIERITLSRNTAHVESYLTETAITRLLTDVYLNADRKSRKLLLELVLSAVYDTKIH